MSRMPCGHCGGKGHFNLGASEGPGNGYRTCPTCYGKGFVDLGPVRTPWDSMLSDADVERIADRVLEKLEQRTRARQQTS